MNQVVVLLFAAILAVLIVSMLPKRKNNEDYQDVKKCICSQLQAGRDKVCQYKDAVTRAYDQEQLTEFTDFPSKGWSTVSPGDIQFPESQGCQNDGKTFNGWRFFDFDMLA